MSGPIDGPRRPLPVAEIARVTPAHEEADKRRDSAQEEPKPAPRPPAAKEATPEDDAPPVAPKEPGKGEKVDYRA